MHLRLTRLADCGRWAHGDASDIATAVAQLEVRRRFLNWVRTNAASGPEPRVSTVRSLYDVNADTCISPPSHGPEVDSTSESGKRIATTHIVIPVSCAADKLLIGPERSLSASHGRSPNTVNLGPASLLLGAVDRNK